jgi:ABC-type transport system substrate-binding protein
MSLNNSQGNPGADLNFRLAVWYAIDNEAVSKATRTTVASKAFGTDHFSDYVKAWDSKPNYMNKTYDLKVAKDYLAKSKYDGRTLKFNARSDEPGKTMATVIQSLLTNAGIKADIVLNSASDQGALWAKADAWDLMLWQIGGGNQIGEYNRVMNNQELGNGMSMGFIKDDKLQELFVAARTAKTHYEAHMTALHDYVLQNAYLYAVASPKINTVYTNKIAQVVLRENEFFLPGGSNYFLD